MITVIGIGGEPATGKSTLMKGLIMQLDNEFGKNSYGKPAELVYAHVWQKNDTFQSVYILGSYADDKQFPGTDTLSMAVQPKVLPWLKSLKDGDTVIFEGDRLFNASFLGSLTGEDDIHPIFYVLSADHEMIKQRHVDRNDTQDDKFIRGRRAKYMNMLMSFEIQPHVETVVNATPEDAIKNMGVIMQAIKDTQAGIIDLPF